MTNGEPKPDLSDVEARRSQTTTRRMSIGRRLAYAIGKPLLRLVLFALQSTYRFEKIIGSDIADRIIADRGQPYVPVYWHANQIAGSWLIRNWIRRGFKAGYIISASVDGEVPADLASSWGAEVIRGSAKGSASLVLRDAVMAMKRGVSIVTMSDGPEGPKFEIKSGTVLMARMGNAPLVPIACAAKPAWTLRTWDAFAIPLPFARVVVAVGEPVVVPRDMSEIEYVRQELQTAMGNLLSRAEQQLS